LQDPAYNISIENHEFGLPVEHYDTWPVLKDHYKILTTAKDRCRGRAAQRWWLSTIMLAPCSPLTCIRCSCTEASHPKKHSLAVLSSLLGRLPIHSLNHVCSCWRLVLHRGLTGPKHGGTGANLQCVAFHRKGLEYVSTIESKHHPFFGTQWHPEKPPFEFAMDVRMTALPEACLRIHLRSSRTRARNHRTLAWRA